MDNGTVRVNTFVDNWFHSEVQPVGGVVGEDVSVYVNGTFHKNATITLNEGAVFSWRPERVGAYVFNVSYWGNWHYLPSGISFVALASASPVSLNFTVTPTEFEPGSNVNLWVKSVNPSTTPPVPLSGLWIQFWEDDSGRLVAENQTSSDGVATAHWVYPTDQNAHTIVAKVRSGQAIANVTVALRPVTLNVGFKTRLLLNVTREASSLQHVVQGWLKKCSSAVTYKPVRIRVNETEYLLTTDGNGHFSKSLDFQIRDNKPTLYLISASFEGDNAKNATAYATTIDGNSYPACTTTYYGYKPSVNSTSLTIEPQATQVTQPIKTSEEMKEIAIQLGALVLSSFFRWQYPWFLIQATVKIGSMIMEFAFNPVLPGGEEVWLKGLEVFHLVTEEIWRDIIYDLAGLFISYAAAKALDMLSFATAGLFAEAIKGVFQWALFLPEFSRATTGSLTMLAAGLANIIMGFVAIATNIAEGFVSALFNILWAPVYSAVIFTTTAIITVAAPLKVVRTAVDYVESLVVDFPMAIMALLRYSGKI